jgi:streptomycin 3"-adenylyltransferase
MHAELERGELPNWPRPDPDVAVLIETARRAAVPLIGPPVAVVLGPAPRVDLIRAMVDPIPVLTPGIEKGDDVRNGLLALARIWTTLATDGIRPKDEAAGWALARLPEEYRPALVHACAAYLGEVAEDGPELAPWLRPHVDHAVERIRTLAAEG